MGAVSIESGKQYERKLKITAVNLERVHRVGKITNYRPRDIITKFTRFPECETVFQTRNKLIGTNIYINEDFCLGTVEVRKKQMENMREARKEGKQAFFNYRTLIVRGTNSSSVGGRGGRVDEQQVEVRKASYASQTPLSLPSPIVPTTLRTSASSNFKGCASSNAATTTSTTPSNTT